MYYIGANHPLPVTPPWDKSSPRFHVVPVQSKEEEEIIRNHLKTRNIVYIGSYEGCGCAFYYEPEKEYLDDIEGIPDENIVNINNEDRQKRKQSVSELQTYLKTITKEGPVRLLVTWAGDEETVPQIRTSMTPDDFSGDGFSIDKFTIVEVKQ
jgi:hypothetical protein